MPEWANSQRLVSSVGGIDLHGGLPGIALFLGHLGAITGEGRYGRIADAAMREALSLYRQQAAWASPGAFVGIGGLGYALVHLAAVTKRKDLATEASVIISKAARNAARSTDLDLIAGLAGFVVAGLVVARFNRDARLIESLRPAVDKVCRLTSSAPRRHPASILSDSESGVAHGRAGAGLALLRWAEATGEAQFRAAGEALVRKDLEVQEAILRNPSAKDDEEHPTDPQGWCRGTTGITMVALGANPPVKDPFDSGWVKSVALEIAACGTHGALCLCHGALGRLEFLSLAKQRRLLDGCSKDVRLWRRRLLSEIVGGRWVADAMHTLESPGLMLGLAGTGYSLLRAALGNRVPSVLGLEDAAVSST